MDKFDTVLLFIFLIIIALIVIGLIGVIADEASKEYCISLGYDNGEQLFWQWQIVCSNVIQEEKIEYFFLPK